MEAINFENIQADSELNAMQKKVNTKTRGVEIFSDICAGKDVSKYGKDVDAVMNYIKSKGQAAVNGDKVAASELNAIRTEQIEAPLLKRLNIFDFMGDKTSVGYNEELRYKVYNLEGKLSGEQAVNGSFPFASYTFSTKTMDTSNITGGVVVDHREFAAGNTDAIQVMNEQVVTDMLNKAFYKVQNALYNGIKNAPIKNFAEASGIAKAAVDAALKKARRFGNVTITGDYSVISQLADFTGWQTLAAASGGSATYQFSDAVIEEVRKTGLLQTYKGSSVVEIPNAFNLTKLDSAGTFYDTYLPEGLLYFLVTGALSPLKIGFKGGLQSMTGQDIATRSDVIRYDLEMGTAFIDQYAFMLGLVSDSSYSVTK